ESAIFSGPSFREPRIRSLVASSAIPCWVLGSVAVPARMLPWTATVGLSVVRYSRHLTPLAIECSSTSLGRSESMPMVVPHTYGPTDCPVLDRQIFPGDFRDLLSSYPRQLLDQRPIEPGTPARRLPRAECEEPDSAEDSVQHH